MHASEGTNLQIIQTYFLIYFIYLDKNDITDPITNKSAPKLSFYYSLFRLTNLWLSKHKETFALLSNTGTYMDANTNDGDCKLNFLIRTRTFY